MSTVLKAIARNARRAPGSIAIEGETLRMSYATLQREIDAWSQKFRARGYRCLGLLMDNGPAWVVIDLAAVAGV